MMLFWENYRMLGGMGYSGIDRLKRAGLTAWRRELVVFTRNRSPLIFDNLGIRVRP